MPLSWNEIKDRAIRDNLLECTGLDWGKISPAIFGNPPFVGKSLMNAAQKADMERVFSGVYAASSTSSGCTTTTLRFFSQ